MMRIKQIEKKERKKGIYFLFIENGPRIEVHQEIVMKYGLKADDFVEDDLIQSAVAETEYLLAKDIVLKYLRNKDRSINEVKRYLEGKGFNREVIRRSIDFIKNLNLVDDQIYAENYVIESLRKGIGELKIRYELNNKGVDNYITEKIIQKHLSEEEAYKNALEIIQKKFTGDSWNEKTKARIGRFLLSKGYREETIYQVLETLS